MDVNDFYYTLSTISQTLAGAFGFLVAVVLYRMQSIKDSLPTGAWGQTGAWGSSFASIRRSSSRPSCCGTWASHPCSPWCRCVLRQVC